jgi:hypothetical protein
MQEKRYSRCPRSGRHPGRQRRRHHDEGVRERGARIPRLDTILKLADGLSISPCELIEGMVWEPGSFLPGGFDLASRPEQAAGGSGEDSA